MVSSSQYHRHLSGFNWQNYACDVKAGHLFCSKSQKVVPGSSAQKARAFSGHRKQVESRSRNISFKNIIDWRIDQNDAGDKTQSKQWLPRWNWSRQGKRDWSRAKVMVTVSLRCTRHLTYWLPEVSQMTTLACSDFVWRTISRVLIGTHWYISPESELDSPKPADIRQKGCLLGVLGRFLGVLLSPQRGPEI